MFNNRTQSKVTSSSCDKYFLGFELINCTCTRFNPFSQLYPLGQGTGFHPKYWAFVSTILSCTCSSKEYTVIFVTSSCCRWFKFSVVSRLIIFFVEILRSSKVVKYVKEALRNSYHMYVCEVLTSLASELLGLTRALILARRGPLPLAYHDQTPTSLRGKSRITKQP